MRLERGYPSNTESLRMNGKMKRFATIDIKTQCEGINMYIFNQRHTILYMQNFCLKDNSMCMY